MTLIIVCALGIYFVEE